jgi:2-polyprenyl-3-methyl-5-hydroxy-6-metoxy-1,4-benzoquinol methylase
MVVWLKNIDRLLNLIGRDINLGDYSLIDVGCGTGISTIYFANKANFKSVIGFDYSKELINIAKKNQTILSKTNSNIECQFFVADANTHTLNEEPSILFLFNPFGENTLRTFLNNNYNNIKGSILLYANDLHINTLLEYGELLERHATFNLSVVKCS